MGPNMNAQKPLVTVVIPFFNGVEFIEETIASVFAQTMDDWELLLIDDGSTCRSPGGGSSNITGCALAVELFVSLSPS